MRYCKRIGTLLVIVTVISLFVYGCGSDNKVTGGPGRYVVNVQKDLGSGEPVIAVTAPDGTIGGPDLISAAVMAGKVEGKDVSFVVQASNTTDGRMVIGNYEITFTWHKHPLYGCINRDVWHAGFLIKNNAAKWVICDIHVAAWWQNGPQIGVYVTRGEDWHTSQLYCTTTRGSFTAVRDAICEALKRVQIPSLYAYLMATAIAVILIPIFALA